MNVQEVRFVPKKISLVERGKELSRAHCGDVEYKANVLTRLKAWSMGMKMSVIDGNVLRRDLHEGFGDFDSGFFFLGELTYFKAVFVEK